MARSQLLGFASSTLFAVLLTQCGGDEFVGSDEDVSSSGDDATSGETSSAEQTEATPGDDTSGEDTDSDTTGGQVGPDPARGGITLAQVTVNQGVELPISKNGNWYGPNDRWLRIAHGRRLLLRGYWSVPADWVPREIEARLSLTSPEIEPRVIENVAWVEGESFAGDINRTFTWGLEGEEVVPGLEYRIELFEVEENDDVGEAPELPPADPADGPELIGIEASDMTLKIVMVPVHFRYGSCEADSADVLADEDVVQSFHEAMYVQNPVQNVELTVHEKSIDFTDYEHGEGFARLLSNLQRMRHEDDADPNDYYYALLDRCGSGDHDGAGGYSYNGGADPETATLRVSSGLWCPGCGGGWSEYTFVHEVGHAQGMGHVGCGTGGHTPHEGGAIGVWGFDILNLVLKHPWSTYEYMSYCRPSWMSDWTWDWTWQRIQLLTSWDAAMLTPVDGDAVFGLMLPNGREVWTVTPGRIDPATFVPGHFVELWNGDTLLARSWAAMGVFDDGKTRYVNADLPVDPDMATRIEVVEPSGARRQVSPSVLQRPANR